MSAKLGDRVHGVVNRISGSGNAMLRNGKREEWNLGPLPKDAVDKEVDAVTLDGVWAICLDPSYITQEYISFFSDKGYLPSEIDKSTIETWNFGSSKDLVSEILVHGGIRSAPPKDVRVGDEIDIDLLNSNHQDKQLAYYNESIVFVDVPYAGAGLTLKAIVVGVKDAYIEAEIDTSVDALSVNTGDEVELEVERVNEGEFLGVCQNYPVAVQFDGILSETLCGQRICVEIDEFQSNHIMASLAAPSQSTLEIGTEHKIDILGRSSGYAIGVVAQTPVVIESEELLQKDDKLRLQITEFRSGYAVGSIPALSDCPSVGEIIHVSLPESSSYWVHNDIPVTLPEGLHVEGEMYLGVEEVNPDGIFATVRAIPSSNLTTPGEKIAASVVDSSSFGTLALSDGVPVLLPIHGISEGTDIIAEVVDIVEANILAIVEAVETEDRDFRFSTYHENIQIGTIDARKDSFVDAANHFNAAADIGDSASDTIVNIPKYAATISKTISLIEKGNIETAEIAVVDAIKTLPEDIESKETKVLVNICRLRLQAAKFLLEAIQGVVRESGTNLQNIYQESVARSPLREATQVLQEAEEIVQGTPYEDMVPGILLERVLWLADGEFSSSVHDLSGWTPESPPEMSEFTWPYQFLEEVLDLAGDTNLDSVDESDSVELSSLDVEESVGRDESPTAESLESESVDSESVDADSGTGAETDNAEDAGSEVSVISVQPSSDDSPASDVEEDSKEYNTVTQAETVEESPAVSELDTSSPETAEEVITEDSPLEVVSEVETAEINADLSDLRTKAEKKASSNPVRDTSPETTTVGSQYQRAPAIRDYALARANGVCECCGDPAPFKKPSGEPYLEVHHVDELGKGGEDHPDKVVALCPVCHKRVHHGQDGSLVNKQLTEKLEDGLADVGVE